MSDTGEDPPKRSKKLPPISSDGGDGGDEQKKPVRKKKKKAPSVETNGTTSPKSDETPTKKKVVKKKEGETAGKPTPKKRKKPASTEESEVDPTSARSAASKEEDVTGSKASLISKDTKGSGTPRKKGKKKKKPASTTATPREEDEWGDTLAAELQTIHEDVVSPKSKKEQDEVRVHPYTTETAVLKSQPLEKLFIETDSGFKGENKVKFAKKWAEEEAIREQEPEQPVESTLLFAIGSHRVFVTFCLFLHGLTAGIAMWHLTMTYILLYFSYMDFLEHYRILALPVQCMFYILLVLCTISACDRFDIGRPTRRFILQSFTLQTGTVSIVIYFIALILSLSMANLEDKINLYDRYPQLWKNQYGNNTLSSAGEDITAWRDINTARCCMAILAWIVLSITASTDRLTDNLRAGDDEFLEDVELGTQQKV
ncbi:transmembrane protein 237-like [Ostrea edulis]|uniref:transmembrane protein 237-like n=1 Tax=Ostrea edulis TaxID=37623 RepID=UPI002094333D|nr:transmembrane protein 237-like [Ostrea edulis]